MSFNIIYKGLCCILIFLSIAIIAVKYNEIVLFYYYRTHLIVAMKDIYSLTSAALKLIAAWSAQGNFESPRKEYSIQVEQPVNTAPILRTSFITAKELDKRGEMSQRP